MCTLNNKYNQLYRMKMKLTKKQAMKFKNNPNINPITNCLFTESEANMYQKILDAYCTFITSYMETLRRKPLITMNQSYYCDNFSDDNNYEKVNKNKINEFVDDCISDTES